jgi:ADP-ribosylglycohydrolase
MKLSPLAFYYSLNELEWEEKQKQIEILCKMTHATPVAVVTSCVLCFFEEEIFKNPSVLKFKEEIKKILQKTMELSKKLDLQYIHEESNGLEYQKTSPRLQLLLDNFDNLSDDKIIEISEGATFYCLNSMTAVIGLLCSCECNFNDIERSIYIGKKNFFKFSRWGHRFQCFHGWCCSWRLFWS